MVQSPRIAIVAPRATDLTRRLAEMCKDARVQVFRDLYADAESLRRFQPAAIFAQAGELRDEDTGALRMCRAWMPEAGLVLLGEAAQEDSLRQLAERLNADLLLAPTNDDQLSAALGAALNGPSRAMTESLLDLVRGLSDEINNPLMITAGYVQLLEGKLDVNADRDKLDLLQQVHQGIDRLAGTMEKIRLLTQASEVSSATELVDVGGLAQRAARRAADETGRPLPCLRQPPDQDTATLAGHGPLLAAMIEQLCRSGLALLAEHGTATLTVDTGSVPLVRIDLALSATSVPTWRLRRTFEPYYLSRVLRGTTEGLSLFLVQLVAQSHGGRALARWRPNGGVTLEVELPA